MELNPKNKSANKKHISDIVKWWIMTLRKPGTKGEIVENIIMLRKLRMTACEPASYELLQKATAPEFHNLHMFKHTLRYIMIEHKRQNFTQLTQLSLRLSASSVQDNQLRRGLNLKSSQGFNFPPLPPPKPSATTTNHRPCTDSADILRRWLHSLTGASQCSCLSPVSSLHRGYPGTPGNTIKPPLIMHSTENAMILATQITRDVIKLSNKYTVKASIAGWMYLDIVSPVERSGFRSWLRWGFSWWGLLSGLKPTMETCIAQSR
ncbi:hypothetical protein LXL04_003379 [Taraxacum kok-saghyz]